MPVARVRCWIVLVVAACALGCGDAGPSFRLDALLQETEGITTYQAASIDVALTDLFGTPDEPQLPADLPGLAELIDLGALQQAAGPVISHTPGVTQGLYRRHCARCHGVTGDGRGPTARYQAPYPRDFRQGVFKWKSTYRDAPPTADDLHGVLERGVPGTGMPSFALLSQDERDILRQYVQYLAIRGQTERALVGFVADELAENEPLDLSGELRAEFLTDWVQPIVSQWRGAAERVVVAATARVDGAIAEGRDLYHSERAGCYKCHGPEGQGGSIAGKDYEADLDLWSLSRLPIKPSEGAKELLAKDLPIRAATPRALIGSTLHGGSEPGDLFRRLHQGVAGTPMPAVGGPSVDAVGALSDDEIASLAAYVETLLAPQPAPEPTVGEPLAASR